jgi:hypothetical protein
MPMDFEIFVNIAVGLFIIGLAAVMLYERTSKSSSLAEEPKPEKARDK